MSIHGRAPNHAGEPALPVVPPEWAQGADKLRHAPSLGQVIAALLIVAAFIVAYIEGEKRQEGGGIHVMAGRRAMVVYFASVDAEGLIGERHWVAPPDWTPEEALELLMAGPRTEGLVSTIPRGTSVRQLQVTGGVAHVDFSRELQESHPGGSAGELLTVHAIVATLTEFPDIEKVEITVEGETLESLAGHLALDEPLSREGALLLGVRQVPLSGAGR